MEGRKKIIYKPFLFLFCFNLTCFWKLTLQFFCSNMFLNLETLWIWEGKREVWWEKGYSYAWHSLGSVHFSKIILSLYIYITLMYVSHIYAIYTSHATLPMCALLSIRHEYTVFMWWYVVFTTLSASFLHVLIYSFSCRVILFLWVTECSKILMCLH